MVICIHPQCALSQPPCLQDHLVLETLPPFRIILHWTTLPRFSASTILRSGVTESGRVRPGVRLHSHEPRVPRMGRRPTPVEVVERKVVCPANRTNRDGPSAVAHECPRLDLRESRFDGEMKQPQVSSSPALRATAFPGLLHIFLANENEFFDAPTAPDGGDPTMSPGCQPWESNPPIRREP